MRVIVRGFIAGQGRPVKVFEETHQIDPDDSPAAIRALATRHEATLVALSRDHMIELEFPDEPEHERFFRFGTDPTGMVVPIPVFHNHRNAN